MMNRTTALLLAGSVLAAPFIAIPAASASESVSACVDRPAVKSDLSVTDFSGQDGTATFTLNTNLCGDTQVVLQKNTLPADWATQTGLYSPQTVADVQVANLRYGTPVTLHVANVNCEDVQVDAYFGNVVRPITKTNTIGSAHLLAAVTIHPDEYCTTPPPPVEPPVVVPPVVTTPVVVPPVVIPPVVTPPVTTVKVATPQVVVPTSVNAGTGGQAASSSDNHLALTLGALGGLSLLAAAGFGLKRVRA